MGLWFYARHDCRMSLPAPGRNEPCPCGSGLRYKRCHGLVTAAVESPMSGQAANQCGSQSDTESGWRAILGLNPHDAEALFCVGDLARNRGDLIEAIRHFELALVQAPANTAVLNNLGLTLEAAGRISEAEHQFRRASALAPDTFEFLANLAQNLYQQKRFHDALACFDEVVLRFNPQSASIWANRAVCQIHAGDLAGAERSLGEAIARDDATPGLHRDLGFLRIEQKQYAAAARAFEDALALEPDSVLAQGSLLFCRQNLADWRDFATLRRQQLIAAQSLDANPKQRIAPFGFMAICDDPALQRKAAESWMRTKRTAIPAVPSLMRTNPATLRLGFVGGELSAVHPVTRLIIELLERLDRRRFHVSLIVPETSSPQPVDRRLPAAVDTFIRVSKWNAAELCELIRKGSIDVLFDLDGLTGRTVIDAFRRRPAPLQINFLGYTGTLGSAAYDFMVTDRHCVPHGAEVNYTERPLLIDPCYLPSDSRRELDQHPIARAQYGLPEQGIVLCAFGGTYKILPGVFAAWMALLKAHSKTVLWLRDAGRDTNERLRSEAGRKGVDGSRLIFARTDPMPRYLSRFRLADLFVDTSPFGSHTTVNDALWAGLPVLTIDGASFAGRASASQVLAAGMAGMVAADLDDYLAIADRLLGQPNLLAEITEKLRTTGRSSPLFDMSTYAQKFGEAVLRAWQGAAPASSYTIG